MAGRRAFKSDESFLEKISMGAIGTKKVFSVMNEQGHRPIELERFSMSYKIWKGTKIKRIRVPDILCLNCGIRIESRAKNKLELSMSHSLSDPERGWDYGMNNQDGAAFIVCHKNGKRPIDWSADNLVQFVSIAKMREAVENDQIGRTKPKGTEEGSEIRIVWPTCISPVDGEVEEISEKWISIRDKDTEILVKRKYELKVGKLGLLVKVGDNVRKNQIIASVVPVTSTISCRDPPTYEYLEKLLKSKMISERYTGVKAISILGIKSFESLLSEFVADRDEHVYIRLEASAGLARIGNDVGWKFIHECLNSQYRNIRLEAVIILGEIKTSISCDILCKILLDKEQDEEIRAAAAWALGELRDRKALDSLILAFNNVNENIRIEAARALSKLASIVKKEIIEKYPELSPIERPGASWALNKSGQFTIGEVENCFVDEDSRQWVAYMIGSQKQEKFINEIEALKEKDPEVYFAVTVLWKIMASWVYDLEEY